MLAAAADPSGTDLVATLAHASPTVLMAIAVVVLATQRVVPYARLREMQKQLDAKDAALQRKDDQIQGLHAQNQALVEGIVDKAIPALARSALVLEKFHTDVTVRRSE